MLKVSFIICTYNGEKKIAKVVESIVKNHSNTNDYEIILVDNNSTDKVAEVFKQSSFSLNSRVVLEKKQGLINARIKGLNAAVNEIVIFVDDDNYITSNIINEIRKHFTENIGAMGGQGILPEQITPPWLSSLSKGVALGSQSNSEKLSVVKSLYGACLCVRKSLLLKYYENGYIPALSGRNGGNEIVSGEDSEICEMIKNLGYICIYNPKITFIHDVNIDRFTKQYFLDLYSSFGVAFVKILPMRYSNLFNRSRFVADLFLCGTFCFLITLNIYNRLLKKKTFHRECYSRMISGAIKTIFKIIKFGSSSLVYSAKEFDKVKRLK